VREVIRLVLLVWIGLAGLGLDARAQGTVAPGGVAVGRDIRESTINIGITPDQVAVITEALKREQKLTDEQRKLITELEGKLGVGAGALRAFFRTLGEADVPPERQEGKLVEIAERHKQLVAQLTAAPGDDPEVAKLKGEAKAALDAGQLERADDLLARVQAAQDAALDRRQLEWASTAGQRGEIALTRLRYRDAAQHFAAAAQRVPPGHEEQSLAYLDREASALRQQGDEFGDNPALADAIDRYRALLKHRTRERVPLEWAAAQTDLGIALTMLGERESGTARLEEAVAAHRAALQEYTRERVPLDWAETQDNLGSALRTLGERTHDRAKLEEARKAVDAAFEVLMQAGQEHRRRYFEDRLREIDGQLALH
jgi:tetratricopeptide (TPR) repeat protein